MSVELPKITVIMPIRNESEYIERSLGAVLMQDYPKDKMEVIVVDGMSTDDTRDIIQRISVNNEISITILDNPNLIVPTAMNTGIRQANGEVVVRVDGHAVIKSDYIRRCIDHLLRNCADCVGGVINSVGAGYVGKTIAIAMNSKFGVGGSGFRTVSGAKPILAESVPFGAYRKEVFDRVGPFNEQMVRHQDYEFCYRLRKDGGKIFLLPTARADYYVRSSLKSLWRQFWQYGIWKGRFVRKYPDSLRIRHLVPPVFVLMLIAAFISSTFSNESRFFFTFLVGLYGLFLVIASLITGRSRNLIYAPILPFIFAVIHLSWGIGVWIGLLSSKIPQSKIRTAR